MMVLVLFSISPVNSSSNDIKWTDHTLVAHALGENGDKSYTNSYEAFIANYEKGQRLFEVDLQMTSD